MLFVNLDRIRKRIFFPRFKALWIRVHFWEVSICNLEKCVLNIKYWLGSDFEVTDDLHFKNNDGIIYVNRKRTLKNEKFSMDSDFHGGDYKKENKVWEQMGNFHIFFFYFYLLSAILHFRCEFHP